MADNIERVDSKTDEKPTDSFYYASNGSSNTNGQHSRFPPVRFDTTLHDMFLDGREGPLGDWYCSLKPNSDLSYGGTVPVNQKYIIHSAQVGTASDLAHLQMEITSYLLMFYAGPMKVVFMGAEGDTEDETLYKATVAANAKRSYDVIDEAQRPKIT